MGRGFGVVCIQIQHTKKNRKMRNSHACWRSAWCVQLKKKKIDLQPRLEFLAWCGKQIYKKKRGFASAKEKKKSQKMKKEQGG